MSFSSHTEDKRYRIRICSFARYLGQNPVGQLLSHKKTRKTEAAKWCLCLCSSLLGHLDLWQDLISYFFISVLCDKALDHLAEHRVLHQHDPNRDHSLRACTWGQLVWVAGGERGSDSRLLRVETPSVRPHVNLRHFLGVVSHAVHPRDTRIHRSGHQALAGRYAH